MKIEMSNAATFKRYSVAPVQWDVKGGVCPQRGRLVDVHVQGTTFAAGDATTPGLRPWSRLIT